MLSVDWPSTECRPITDRYIGQVSTNYRRSVGERKAISAETHLERLSTVSRPSVDRLSTAMSTECRPSINRVSTEYRPTVDRLSTEYRPTVDRLSTAISTDISVDITHSKQDPICLCSGRFMQILKTTRVSNYNLDFMVICHAENIDGLTWFKPMKL